MKKEVASGPGGRVVVMDSITNLAEDDAGALVVSGSHGGSSAAEFALRVPVAGAFFNDAGIGKDQAGIAALAMLEAHSIPAATVAHTSARIGDGEDTWVNGVVTHANAAARRIGVTPGSSLRASLMRIIGA